MWTVGGWAAGSGGRFFRSWWLPLISLSVVQRDAPGTMM